MKLFSFRRNTWFKIGAVGASTLGLYLLWIRPWQLRWGATNEEVVRPMPGDDVVQKPIFNATRAVTIYARPEHIWPWILQIGVGRAGWYSYDLIDNLGRPSARSVLPPYQQPQPGDLIPMSPDGKLGLFVKDFEPKHWMLWWDKTGIVSWAWGLYPIDENSTRLITRVRMRYSWKLPEIIFDLLLDVGDIIMMRKCMLGIKERAEAFGRQQITLPVPVDGVVISDYQAAYTDPLELHTGEEVTLGRTDPDWPGWIWCTNQAGKAGWVPETYLEQWEDKAILRQDYNTRELSIRIGEHLHIDKVESGWYWVTDSHGQIGWVPATNIQAVESDLRVAPFRNNQRRRMRT